MMFGPDSEISEKVRSITEITFKSLYQEANRCADHRGKGLKFRRAKSPKEIKCGVDGSVIAIYLQSGSDETTFEHHAAHELSHAIAGCCGFSLDIRLSKKLEDKQDCLDNNQFDRITNEEIATITLAKSLGSYLTHIAVHDILKSAGYLDRNWDSYLLDDLHNSSSLDNSLENRANSVGLMIQYEQLEKLSLPGLNVVSLKRHYLRLIHTFEEDYGLIRDSADIEDLETSIGCLKSTKSLAKAFGGLFGYPVEEHLTIQTPCAPTEEWNLVAVADRLSTI